MIKIVLYNFQKLYNTHENRTFTLATDEKSSRKIANSKYDPIDSEMSEMYGRTAECWHTYKIGKVPHECIPACSDRVWF